MNYQSEHTYLISSSKGQGLEHEQHPESSVHLPAVLCLTCS